MTFFSKPRLIAVAVGCSVLALALVLIFRDRFGHSPDERLASPASILGKMQSTNSSYFVSPEFLPFIPVVRKSAFPSRQECESASRDKSVFWNLNREHHYAGVFLGSSPAWHPLADSLMNSPVWVLSDVSPWGYLFSPKVTGVSEWKAPTKTDLEVQWPDITNRARYLMLTAANLTAINHLSEAAQLLDQAADTHRLPSLLQCTKASLAASRGQWEEAASLAKESLHIDHSNRAASEILIRALIETSHTDEALHEARNLVEQYGEDEASLFLLARASNAANSGQEEIDALAHLVTLARKDHQPLGASLTYLGQAYAKQGDRGGALRAFQEASLTPELSESERKILRQLMDHLMEGDRSSSTLPPLPSPTPAVLSH